jgi:hypothetical protein
MGLAKRKKELFQISLSIWRLLVCLMLANKILLAWEYSLLPSLYLENVVRENHEIKHFPSKDYAGN